MCLSMGDTYERITSRYSSCHSALGSEDARFESWRCQVDIESLGKALYMHFLTHLILKRVPDSNEGTYQYAKVLRHLYGLLLCNAPFGVEKGKMV